ncbi:nuclear transport factor 2 family protein [Pseudomonas saliphila]|uniref:nuclear transport factor 2 family protein n=1 Tax=Pseudomonas saliphila TaxID=2586906 RepID=UPI0015B74FCB|nr:nuclear transport factor 2 family protein [Pseudomonas saliphila]
MQTWQDHQDISALLIQYGCALDERDWDALARVFIADAQVDYGSLGVFYGRQAIVEVARAFIESCGPTQHLIGNIRISVDGDQAQAKCYVQATHAAQQAKDPRIMTLWGEYRDLLVRSDTGWAIEKRSLHIQHLDGDIGAPLKGSV